MDHLVPDQVRGLVARIEAEQGALHVLVNDIWGATTMEWNMTVWESSLEIGLRTLRLAVDTHAITSHFAIPLLIRTPGGLVVEVTDGLRSEAMLEAYGVTESNCRDATKRSPDFAISVGPLAPGALRDYRGRRMVLLVLYALPGSRARMTELARSYDLLSIIGVEVIAVPTHASPESISELGSSPPVLFPVVTDGNADIVATYGIFAPGAHAELLIDRQGYIRAIWRADVGGMPRAAAVQSQVEKLNEEKSPPPFPDDHVH